MRKKTSKSYRRKSVDNRSRAVQASKANARTWHKILAIKLRRIRAERHITLETLVRKTGFTLAFVKKVERVENPRLLLAHAEIFAKALGVEVSDLVMRRRAKGA